jgi:hypothetical protein
MNRQELLVCIESHLRANLAETGEARPLGEIVPSLAAETRALTPQTMTANGSEGQDVIPVWQIAAFVDGELSDEEAEVVCRAALIDNSVLAELAAAIREQITEAPALSDSLESRLVALAPVQPVQPVQETAEPVADNPAATDDDWHAEPQVEGSVRRRVAASTSPIDWSRLVPASMIAAAVILLALLAGSQWLQRDAADTGEHRVDNDSSETNPRLRKENSNRRNGVPNANDQEKKPIPPNDGDSPRREDTVPNTNDVGPTRIVQEPQKDTDSIVGPSHPDSGSPGIATGNLSLLRSAAWQDIEGVLAQSTPAATSSPTATSRDRWTSLTEGERLGKPTGLVQLRTLPFSRAEGTSRENSRVVLATDTQLNVESGGRPESPIDALDLLHGGVAMLGWPKGSEVQLRQADRLVTLAWHETADVVLEHSPDGLRLDVSGGTIHVDGEEVRNEGLLFSVQPTFRRVARAKKHPNWVREVGSRSRLPKDVLEELGRADNIVRTLTQRFNTLASDPDLSAKQQRTLEELAQWRAALAGKNLHRMASSRNAALRIAALQRLVEMPKWDPRYADAWHGIDRVMDDQQGHTRIRRWCELAQRGGQPTPAQVEQLLSGLQANQVFTRAMSDYLLRRFVGGGPPFDPNWTGQTRNRAVNVWRKAAGRPRAQ